VDKPYLDNGRFQVRRGKQYIIAGRLFFPPPINPKTDGNYRTRFGPYVSHTGVIYAKEDLNTSKALTRLTCARENPLTKLPDLDWDNQLSSHQEVFIQDHRAQFATIAGLYAPGIEFAGTFEEARLHHADPHDKRELRVHCWKEMHETGLFFDDVWLTLLTLKMKPNEIAKPLKYPRCIGDLGVAASLQGFVLTSLLKHAQEDNPIHYLGGVASFMASPSPTKLENAFKELIEPRQRWFFCYFSDDACFSIRHNGRIYRFNVDISQCDASHRDSIFDLYVSMFPESVQADARKLTDQCKLPFQIRSDDGRHQVILEPQGHALYSGSTITTGINNLANQCIAMSFAEAAFDGTAESLKQAALRAGYMITVVDCSDDWHKLQFLKHSPVLDTTGTLRALLNVGVLLRLTGTCNGDLPGRGPLDQRARAFQHGLLRGASPLARYKLLDNMLAATGEPLVPPRVTKMIDDIMRYRIDFNGDEKPFHVDDSEVYARYDLLPHEVDELNEGLGHARFGMIHRSRASDKILEDDYGLTPGHLV
jgi:hypothetical protein